MTKPTIRMVWGLAKCPELSLTDEELHLIVSAHTGKDSIKQLNQRELRTVIGVLGSMKSSAAKNSRGEKINGLCRKMFGVACVEWLSYQQCSKLIEALKAMAGREGKQDAE